MPMLGPENTHLLCEGKYHCVADLLLDFIWIWPIKWNCCSFNKVAEYKQNKQVKSYSDTSPFGECSLAWLLQQKTIVQPVEKNTT